jgi:hypothetical protein
MGAYQSYVSSLSPQPVVWFKFDELGTSTTTVADSGTANNRLLMSTTGTTGAARKSTGGKDTGYLDMLADDIISFAGDSSSVIPAYLNYTVSFWIKRQVSGGSYSGFSPFGWGDLDPYRARSGSTASIESDGKLYWYTIHGGVGHDDLSTNDLRTGQWIHITYVRTGATVKLYQNGSLLQTATNAGTASSPGLTGNYTFRGAGFGGTGLDEFLLFDYAMDATQVLALYNHAPAGINKTITETPATATALMVNPSTTMSHVATPATATAQISYLSVSGSANYPHDFASANAIQTDPTIVATDGNNVEIVTAITVTALMVNPSNVVASINITNAVAANTATADIGEHNTVTARTISYVADVVGTASSQFTEPFRFGSPDRIITETPATATALMVDPVLNITPNYYNYVRRNSPYLYLRNFAGGNSTLLNEGSLNYGTVDKGSVGTSSWQNTIVASGEPMSFIDDGTSLQINSTGNTARWKHSYGNTTATVLAQMYASKNWTYEFWHKPSTSSLLSSSSNFTYNDAAFIAALTYTTTTTNLSVTLNDGATTQTSILTNASSLMTHQNWHHIVIRSEYLTSTTQRINLYIDGYVAASQVFTITGSSGGYGGRLSPSGTGSDITFLPNGGASQTLFDEIAVYPSALSNNEIIEHYTFVDTNTPNKIFFAPDLEASALMVDPTISRVANVNFPSTPITASSLFVDPAVIARINLNISATPITASALSVNPSFYGTPDYRKNAEVLTAFIEMSNNNFALDDTYYAYILANITPYRYVSFDGTNPAMDYGSDSDFSVIPTVYGGSLTSPAFGINNISIKTSSSNYTTAGVILKESQYNDDWGTSTDHHHSSFWMQRDGDDPSNGGVKVLWNLNGYYDNQHIILFHYQDKLHLQLNNQTQYQSFTSANNVNIFDYERHHIVINFDHSGVNNLVKIYVDSVLVLTANIGSMTLQTINGVVNVGPNDEANNYPRLSVGCLITPFASTSLPNAPTPMRILVDEIHWAKTTLTAGQITSLYNAMPAKDNTTWYADFFIASNANIPMPVIRGGNTRSATPLTASGIINDVQISTVYNKVVSSPAITASAQIVQPTVVGDNVRTVNFVATFMFASAFISAPQIIFAVSAQPMIATAKMPASLPPWYDPYRALIIQQSLTYPAGNYYGFKIGDID